MPKGGAAPAGANPQRKQAALSLAGFASAKASTYDKKAVQQKKRALNSKVVNKYRKLKSRLQPQTGYQAVAAEQDNSRAEPDMQQRQPTEKSKPEVAAQQREPDTDVPAGERPWQQAGKKRKRRTELQKIAASNDAERDEARRHKQEMLQAAQQRKEERKRSQKERKRQKAQFRKKTRSGQPVMKFRIGKVLSQLQSEAEGGG